jgi:hypothetical protein
VRVCIRSDSVAVFAQVLAGDVLSSRHDNGFAASGTLSVVSADYAHIVDLQSFLWFLSVVSVLLFFVFFTMSIVNELSSSTMIKRRAESVPSISPWSVYTSLSHRLQIKFVAFIVFSWQNWRRVPFLGRTKSAFVNVPLHFWSDQQQRLIVNRDDEVSKQTKHYGSDAFRDTVDDDDDQQR